ncbi:Rv3235 family protein [Streptomyces sp. NPDC058001]|uniref:Rv3235 family protein n=1 Tax=Streptomyces sp. NPDC058001 TaxID=3346300 RepID=UPI0036F0C7DA
MSRNRPTPSAPRAPGAVPRRPPGRRDSRRPGGGPGGTSRAGTVRPGGTPGGTSGGTSGASGGTSGTSGGTSGTSGGTSGGTPARTAAPHDGGPRPTDLFADRLVAVLSGRRPVHWILRHTAGRAYDELAWLAERTPLRTRGPAPVVRDIGYFVPRADAIEAFARIAAGEQLRAMAFRLERGVDLRWRCTAVELGGTRMPHRQRAPA